MMEKITNPDILKRQAETRERFKAARTQLEQAKTAALMDEDRRRMQITEAALEQMKTEREAWAGGKSEEDEVFAAFARVTMPQGSSALEAPIDPDTPFRRSEFRERLDLHYSGWRDAIPEFPELNAAELIELAEYCEQIVDELQDTHTRDTLHSVFVAVDNQIGTASNLLTENSYLAVLALVNALELFDEQEEGAADHSKLIGKYQAIAVSCLDIQAQIMRDRAADLAPGANEVNEGE
ncbi:hypothetical protein [Rhizobium esperanzae]|nr:hypothetical protein [Rhizobium esperanzae]